MITILFLQTKANDGEGPELLQSSNSDGSVGHAESLAATLAEHQQHLASFQVQQFAYCIVFCEKIMHIATECNISMCPLAVDIVIINLIQYSVRIWNIEHSKYCFQIVEVLNGT